MRLNEKICLITGAGSGIGRSTALTFAKEGAVVIVNDIDEKNGNETKEMIESDGGKSLFIKADVTNSAAVKGMVIQIMERFQRLDVLFNNAGIANVGPLHEVNIESWDKLIDVNVKGIFLPSKYVLPHMMDKKAGVIINMSSCVAEIGLSKRAAYATSKGAVLAMTKSMQVDYASYNIRVNALLPGTIYTPFVENYLKSSYDDPTEAIEGIKKRQLSEALGTPEDVAEAALFLASDESKFMMGSPLYVDGGVVFGKDA
ncbi:SDR family NAD(P)-dependent oxidoreductase [Salibacterium aidingense]|uniref:SDR family NAD(P)-dependent oxidoreductase n=1 Tax=Salibacterium aidingense TaxID=384933 RepID=UPI003BDCF736